MTIEMTMAFATELFWEYLRGNADAYTTAQDLNKMDVTVSLEQLREARMRDVGCGAWSRKHSTSFLMRQPY